MIFTICTLVILCLAISMLYWWAPRKSDDYLLQEKAVDDSIRNAAYLGDIPYEKLHEDLLDRPGEETTYSSSLGWAWADAVIADCLADCGEIAKLQSRTKLLDKLNDASYLTAVEDVLAEAQQRLMTNQQHIINRLDNFDINSNKQRAEVLALLEQNCEIIQRSKVLVRETARIVNSPNNSDEAMAALATGIQPLREIIT